MRKLVLSVLFASFYGNAQVGHIMQGMGAANMSMGGASTGQPLSISGALYWNPASISVFEKNTFVLDAGIFYSSPKISSSVSGLSGTTDDEKKPSVMPSVALLIKKEGSKHTFAFSGFGVSGFGVDFPLESNNPTNPSFNPNTNSNPILYPQSMGGFGNIKSNYALFQLGMTYAYKITDKFSIGVNPLFNIASLEMTPNPTANPSMTSGYPTSANSTVAGYGAQIGLFYGGKEGFKAGISYKTKQWFREFTFKNNYVDGATAPGSTFKMNFPAIASIGLGYSHTKFDLALDYRMVNYEDTEGFSEKGWSSTGAVKGFGWQNISVISFGAQAKVVKNLPIRLGYTYSGNPISSEVAMFAAPATAIIKNAFQLGLGYEFSKNFTLNGTYHMASSGGSTSGPLNSPGAVSSSNPMGAIPGSEVSYSMKTSMIQFGIEYKY